MSGPAVCIVDYGLGNVAAFLNMYKRLNVPAEAARTAAELERAERIILPGVGAFDHAMDLLDASGMRPMLERKVAGGVPLAGVCVGMQMLADGSDEGRRQGIGWVPGRVRAFASNPAAARLPQPHMGWNDVAPAGSGRMFAGTDEHPVTEAPRFYFLHSYYFECADEGDRAATSHYGLDFACAVNRGNVWGFQFHPEKSHHFGAALLGNFARA